MTEEWLKAVEPMVHTSRIKVPYSWSVGETGSRFLVEIRDHKRILGKRCDQCDTVYVPPRKMCHHCFRDTDTWVEVGPKGILETYTIVHQKTSILPCDPPFAYGIIRLDGSSTGLVHILGEVDLENLRVGLPVEPVFQEARKGHILDIKYFRPTQSQ